MCSFRATILAAAICALAVSAAPQLARRSSGASPLVYRELDFLSQVPIRRTGSPHHNRFINHLRSDLEDLGLQVHNSTWYFDYNDSPQTPPEFLIDGAEINVSSIVPYSGNTGSEGVSGPLVNLISPNAVPDWKLASGGIAVLNITNAPADYNTEAALWPGSPAWAPSYVQVAGSTANAVIVNLTGAVDAGVKGIVYVWDDISTGLSLGEYGPFWTDYQGIPALFIAPEATETVIQAASLNKTASLTLTGQNIPNTPTYNLWVEFTGTQYPNESVIINTHTDGVNIGEENGHIALLSYARSLIINPPKRTTILVFVTAHIHSAPFSYATHRATTLWLAQNPQYWNGSEGGLTAVFGSCVEHLGMIEFTQDLAADTYTPSNTSLPATEVVFAATSELANITYEEWSGANPNITRVSNPLYFGKPVQGGEGLPYLLLKIPEISLITAPGWLLKQFPHDYDHKKLINADAMQRQIDSFHRIWRRVDVTPMDQLGTVEFSST